MCRECSILYQWYLFAVGTIFKLILFTTHPLLDARGVELVFGGTLEHRHLIFVSHFHQTNGTFFGLLEFHIILIHQEIFETFLRFSLLQCFVVLNGEEQFQHERTNHESNALSTLMNHMDKYLSRSRDGLSCSLT